MTHTQTIDLDRIERDTATQTRAAIDVDTVDDYARAMADGDSFPPVKLIDDGATLWIADGWHRIAALEQLRRPSCVAEVIEGTRRDAILASVEANHAHGLRRSNADKRKAVTVLLTDEEWGQWSDREIASRAGVDHKTVAARRRELSGEFPQIDNIRRVERGGTVYEMDTSGLRTPDTPVVEAADSSGWATSADVADEAPPATSPPAADTEGDGASRARAAHIAARTSSASNEWYTPGGVLELAREMLGDIELDPASCAEANETVGAARIYTEDDDGLAHEWRARTVWCNPPYGKVNGVSQQGLWSSEMDRRHRAGEFAEGLLLVNANTDTRWFHDLWHRPICFVLGRISFDQPGGEGGTQPTQPNAVIYFGDDPQRFRDVFSEIGHVVLPAAHLARHEVEADSLGIPAAPF